MRLGLPRMEGMMAVTDAIRAAKDQLGIPTHASIALAGRTDYQDFTVYHLQFEGEKIVVTENRHVSPMVLRAVVEP